MKVLVIENYAGSGPGLVGDALAEKGAAIELRRMHDGDRLPEGGHHGYDALVVLGGAQSAVDDDTHPYLPALAALTQAFGAADKSVLGICLGSQIIARGHGGRNILGRPIEFGWQPVAPTAPGRLDPLTSALGDGAPLFHWHSDTFELPPGAVHLASSAMTPNQAFRIGRAVYGIQFHFEADTRLVESWKTDYRPAIDAIDPAWPAAHPALAATLGAEADRVGMTIARAFVATIGK